MSTMSIVLAAIAAAVGLLLVTAAMRPDVFKIERTQRITAPPDRIYPLIADLRIMNTWNPFVAPDPNIVITYAGPESGTGARHTWAGNRQVGEGSIEIVDAVPPARVAMRLLMQKPMAADNTVLFTLQPAGGGTDVTWSMSGRQPFLAKLMTVFINCDRMVGSQFEAGLAKLQAKAETAKNEIA